MGFHNPNNIEYLYYKLLHPLSYKLHWTLLNVRETIVTLHMEDGVLVQTADKT